ncbi:unnamed protein product, partial [Symbiodinium pilosum]
YMELMVGVETILASPGEVDVSVSEIFTDAMFQELQALMRQQGIPGVEEVEERMWRSGDLRLRDRKIVSGFIKDRSLGSKRLISMPDRITNTIHVVTRAPSEYKPPPKCRPTATRRMTARVCLRAFIPDLKFMVECRRLILKNYRSRQL